MSVEELLRKTGWELPKDEPERKRQTMVYLMMTKDGKTHSTFRVPASMVKEFSAQKRKEGWKDYWGD